VRRRRQFKSDAAFARALTRSVFGRFYTDERQQKEVRQSLERAKARRKQDELEHRLSKAEAGPRRWQLHEAVKDHRSRVTTIEDRQRKRTVIDPWKD
jgi:hypothetical protein